MGHDYNAGVRRYNFPEMSRRATWILTCLLCFLPLSGPPHTRASAWTGLAALGSNAYDVIDAVNALRAAHGLSPYSLNSTLMGTAQTQANYMASTGTVTHFGADGSRPYQRALAAGYSVAGDLSLGGWFSENIMGGSNLSAPDAVRAWMGDAPHQNTMLSPNLYDIGAGVAVDGNFYYYVIDCGASTAGSILPSLPAGGGTEPVAGGSPAAQDQTMAIVLVSTPDAKGDVYHEVQAGQTLWQIAQVYQTTVDQIKRLNGLTSDNIYIGQRLLIARAGTPTPTRPAPTPTRDPSTETPLPTLAIFTETATQTAGPVAASPASDSASAIAVAAISLVALFGAGFMAWVGRNRDDGRN
jgi:uncharacterized protein YkwD/LysM repeat protein